ncbi:hypothetical protein [Micromonospora zamorensis]|uniref:hypothetical protein n=1 Tax=Micromonospora zamorensis TaxID=709883 RepID=UPI00378CC81B
MAHPQPAVVRSPDIDDSLVGRYLAAVRAVDSYAASAYPQPERKQHPGARRWPLPWPGPGSPPLTGAALDQLSALLLGFGPRRVETLTSAGFSALSGGPLVPVVARLLPQWLTLRWTVPSGGGFYPTELYLAWAGGADLPAGIYHYDHLHHCLEHLRSGSPARHLDRLLGPGPPRHALLLAHRPWKNASKYGIFGYRLSLMDAGILLGQLLTSPSVGSARLDPDPALAAELLGLDSELETCYATIEFPATTPVADPGTEPLTPISAVPPTGLDDDRRSLRNADPSVIALHRATLADRTAPAVDPAPSTSGPYERSAVELPPVAPLDLARAAARRSSAGNLGPGLTVRQLAAVLAYAGGGRASTPALAALARDPLYPSIWCLARRVDGLPPDAYRYDLRRRLLVPSAPPSAVDTEAALPHLVDLRMAYAGATLYIVSGGPSGAALSPPAFRRQLMLAGVALQLAVLAGQAVGAASRPLGGLTADAVAARMGLPAGAVPLVQLLLGAPAPRPGALAAHLTTGDSHA